MTLEQAYRIVRAKYHYECRQQNGLLAQVESMVQMPDKSEEAARLYAEACHDFPAILGVALAAFAMEELEKHPISQEMKKEPPYTLW